MYIPPYLNQGRKQPTYNITDTDWAYGTQHQIHDVTLFEGSQSTMRISLVAGLSHAIWILIAD